MRSCRSLLAATPVAFTGLLAFGLAVAPASGQAVITINTLPDQNEDIIFFGVQSPTSSNSATYGQTITAPATDSLLDFTFTLDNDDTPTVADAEVYAYNNATNMAIGPALYQSAPFTIGVNSTFHTFTQYTVTPNVPVIAGTQYVLLFTTAGLQGEPTESYIRFGGVYTNPYSGGVAAYQNSGNTHSNLTTMPFIPISSSDLAFQADFGTPVPSPAPEPAEVATLSMFGLGLGGLLLRARRRQKLSVV